MRTATECGAMAAEMERLGVCGPARMRDDWLAMAAFWRDLAVQARWQDDWTDGRGGISPIVAGIG